MDKHVAEIIEKKAIRYIEVDSERYVETGEVVTKGIPIKRDELVASLIDKAPNSGFSIFRDTIMCRMLKNLGSKGKVVSYLVKHNPVDNMQITTIRNIAEETGVSIQAITDCLKMLEEIGIISIKSEYGKRQIFLNPGIAHRGNRYRERALMKAFDDFDRSVKNSRRKAKED